MRLLIFFLLLISPVLLQAKNKDIYKIKGKVTEEHTGEPIVGVNIIVQELNIGTITDVNGNYIISIPDAKGKVLVFSFVGMKSKEVIIGDSTTINVKLSKNYNLIDDVVVIGAYGVNQKKSEMVGSASQMQSKSIENLPYERVDKLLEGQIPGVLLQDNTDKTVSTRIRIDTRIRGNASLSASNEPLWIIDGTPYYTGDKTNLIWGMNTSVSPLSYINSYDIKTITVLKDASATAIYGADGANGVILITTKNGSLSKQGIDVSFKYGISKINESTKYKVLNAEEYLKLAKEAYINSGRDLKYFPFQNNEMNNYSETNTDWYKEFYDIGKVVQANLSINGGNKKTKYYISGSLYHNASTLIGNIQNRYSLRSNTIHKLGRKMTLKLNVSASYNFNDIFNPGNDYYKNLPIYSPYNNDGSYRMFNKIVVGKENDGSLVWEKVKFINKVAEREENDNSQFTLASFSSVLLKYNILEGLEFTSQFGIDYQSVFENTYQSSTNWSGMVWSKGEYKPIGHSYRGNVFFLNWTNIERINYNRLFGKHKVSYMLGLELKENKSRTLSAVGSGYNNNFVKEVSYANSTEGFSNLRLKHTASVFMQGSYNFDKRYYFLFNFRKDGNSYFGKNVRWGNFGSAGVSWNIHNENFFHSNIFNFLKIKASYGANGNSRIGTLEAMGIYKYSSRYNYINQSGGVMASAPNYGLSWETTFMSNCGISLEAYNRISLELEFYNNKTVDLLSNLEVSRVTGEKRVYRNVGTIRNRGVEINLETKNVITDDFLWITGLNVSHNNNKLLKLLNGIEKHIGKNLWAEGYGTNTYFLVKWAGVDPLDGSPLWYDADGNITRNYSSENRVPYKSSVPDFSGGITNEFYYKNWNLRIFMSYMIGGYGFTEFGRLVNSDGLNIMEDNQSINQLNRWQKPGDLALVPKLMWGVSSNSIRNSTRFLYNKTHLKLKNIVLSYKLPKQIINKFKIKDCSILFIADNLAVWTPYNNKNQNSYKSTMSAYPMETTLSFGVNMKF